MIDLEELHTALAKIREKYIDDVEQIALYMLRKRADLAYGSAEQAEEDLEQHVYRTFWNEDNHGFLVLYLSDNRDIADRCLEARDVERDAFIHQRAMIAMQADICKYLWGRGWTSIGEQYRQYSADIALNDAIKEVVEIGLKVCDAHEADKGKNDGSVERKLQRAIQELQRINS